jgi:hypothetical protein
MDLDVKICRCIMPAVAMTLLLPRLQWSRKLLMTLAERFLHFVCSPIKRTARPLGSGKRSQYFRHSQPLAVRPDFFTSHSTPHNACPRLPHGRIPILAVVGCLFVLLALGPQNVASVVTDKLMSPLSSICLGSTASPFLSGVEIQLLTSMVPLTASCDVCVTPDDCDVCEDDSPANPLLTKTAYVIGQLPVGVCLNGSMHANPWPFRYLPRPQCLTRLKPLPVGRDISATHHR